MSMETRKAEVTVGVSDLNGCGTGTWETRYVDIPADTPEKDIPVAAVTVARLDLIKENVRGVAFIHYIDVLEPGQEP